jgi:LysM repeat protein
MGIIRRRGARIRLILSASVLVAVLAGALPASAEEIQADGVVHVVRSGETLATIAARYGTSASAIARANGLANADLIRVGQRLAIPGRGSSSNTAPKPSAPRGVYVVKKGDTLNGIARKLGISATALARANGISDPNRIYPGQRLAMPGSSGAAPALPSYSGKASKFVASISQQRCWLYQGGAVIAKWACSTGRRGAATRPGTYKVQSKLGKAWGSSWNFWMPYWLGIYWAGSTENGIHGLPYNPKTGAQTWAGMVGTKITFGCVMLENPHANMLWDMAWIGMPVIIQP